ncbi:NADH-ubiquinone/plastoquinone oxidoreductase chain 3 [Desulfobacca acetoxidans DSM 11109]|uniref:NADH-quinone oxidoreductase subunit n=2 Tax=Desulfobacca acetoxidans TaxID=60893 RepID=F2NHE5_DESAR|nr:NADH-ubiquinone/plastoquinone oxidoreductase chain 3 [Desulfobacca acetoxidans DSM 11109]
MKNMLAIPIKNVFTNIMTCGMEVQVDITSVLHDYAYVLIFLLVGAGFAFGPLVIAHFVAPRSFGRSRSETYECGIPTFGSAWVQVAVIYYLFALIFLAFDVDVIFLFPVLLAFGKGYVWRDFVEIFLFIGILSLVIVYAWCRGVFSWKRKPESR